MNILHLLSQKEITGAEIYAKELIEWQLKKGHKVWVISDTFKSQTNAEYISLPLADKGVLLRIQNALQVRKLIHENSIDIIHAHSRAASWVGRWAAKRTAATLVSTIHGRQGWHGPLKQYDMYGQTIIAVARNIARHLDEELKIPKRKITVIPNGVRFSDLAPTAPSDTILWAGRTSGPKGEVLADFLANAAEPLLLKNPTLKIHIAGGPLDKLPKKGQEVINALKGKFPGQLEFLGFVNNLSERITQAGAVIGSGRVAIEALGAGRPVLAIGEAFCHGWVTDQNWEECLASNFGDIAAARNTPPPYIWSLASALSEIPAPDPNSAERTKAYFHLETVAEQVLETYKSARIRKFKPGYIPVLMYHKIPEKPIDSPHRIFVTAAVFEKQLAQIKRAGYQTISFSEYNNFREGAPGATLPKKPIVLTFDDGYLDNYTNARPLLKRFGFTGTIYALGTDAHTFNFWDVEKGEAPEPLMSASQLKEMADAGFEIGAHTLNHKDLTTLSEAEAKKEISESRSYLQNLTGQPVLTFAYPYGKYNAEIKKWAKEAGFRYSVVISGGGLDWEEDLAEIFRVYVFPEDTGFRFWKKIQPWYRAYFKWKRGI